MQTEQFVQRVTERGPDMSEDDARRATFVTVQALCEHLPAEEARRLASQLSGYLGDAAQAGGDDTESSREGISLNDFYKKIAQRADLSEQAATGYARAVAQTLKEAVTNGEITDVAMELPLDLPELIAYE